MAAEGTRFRPRNKRAMQKKEKEAGEKAVRWKRQNTGRAGRKVRWEIERTGRREDGGEGGIFLRGP